MRNNTQQMELERCVTAWSRLFRNLVGNVQRVAEEYIQHQRRFGKQFRDRVKAECNLSEAWLTLLEEVGSGDADPRLLVMDPEQAEILRTIPRIEQASIIDHGIGKTPFAKVKPDALSAHVHKSAKVNGRVHVKGHDRKKPGKPAAQCCYGLKKDGVLFTRRYLTWAQVQGFIDEAVQKGYVRVRTVA